MQDNRSLPRKPASIMATFHIGGSTYSGAVEDLSLGGLFIRVAQDIPVGVRLSIELSYLDLKKPFSVAGVVVRRRDSGIGVRLEDLTGEQKDLLGFLYW